MSKHREPPFSDHIVLAEPGLLPDTTTLTGNKINVERCTQVLIKSATHEINQNVSEVLSSYDGNITFPDAALQMSISSTSADDAFGGTGCTLLSITGIDDNMEEISEIIALNGQSPVTTVQSYRRINSAISVAAGSTKEMQGDVYFGTGTVTAGVPATVFHVQDAGDLFNTCMYTIPKDHILLIKGVYFTSGIIKTDGIIHYRFRFEDLESNIIRSFADFIGSEDASVSNLNLADQPIRATGGITIWVEAAHNIAAFKGAASVIIKGTLYPILRKT